MVKKTKEVAKSTTLLGLTGLKQHQTGPNKHSKEQHKKTASMN